MGKNYEKMMEQMAESLGQAIEVTKSNSENTAAIISKLNKQERLIGGLSVTVTDINDRLIDVNNEIEQLKLKEEITTTQTEEIRNAACKRIYDILGDNKITHEKYYRTFIKRLYSDTRHCAGLGSSIARTRKCDYQRCIDYIEAWIPSQGCSGLKKEIDDRAKARLVARKQGYED